MSSPRRIAAAREGDAMVTRPATDPTNGAAAGPTDGRARDVTAADRRAARQRRERLHRALVELEEALTAPTGRDHWLPRVRTALEGMSETVLDHVAESEAPDGLLEQIADVAPWLGPRVVQLRAEHDHLVAAADAMVQAAASAAAADEVIDAAWALLEAVSRHRRRGADLLYEAYALDVSAGD
jgi:hypothetical protein